MKNIVLNQLLKNIEQEIPSFFAMDFDNPGLQTGNPNKEIKKVLISLDITEEIIDEAAEKSADCVIMHHPLIFRPLKKIDYSSYVGKILVKAIKNDIALYAAHTNLDILEYGILAKKLKLERYNLLKPEKKLDSYGIKLYIEEKDNNMVLEILKKICKKKIYFSENNSDSSKSEKFTFFETIMTNQEKLQVLNELHSENIHFQILESPINNRSQTFGLGIIGELSDSEDLSSYLEYLKNEFNLEYLRFTGKKDKKIKKIAACGGSGQSLLSTVIRKGADIFVSGDFTHHFALEAIHHNITLADIGHYFSETSMAEKLMEILKKIKEENKLDIEIIRSSVNSNPFNFY